MHVFAKNTFFSQYESITQRGRYDFHGATSSLIVFFSNIHWTILDIHTLKLLIIQNKHTICYTPIHNNE